MDGYTQLTEVLKRLADKNMISKEEAEKKIKVYDFIGDSDIILIT